MTIIAWDGETLAADSFVWNGDVFSQHFNKIIKMEDWIFSIAGDLDDYYKVEKFLTESGEIDGIEWDKLSDDSSVFIFCRDDPKHYYDGVAKLKISQKAVTGSAEEYASGLLHAGMDAEKIIKMCIKNHSGVGGKVYTVKPKEYFGWK